jgi:ABC-type glycerol-3-phosphate transport system substrate-binding protein
MNLTRKYVGVWMFAAALLFAGCQSKPPVPVAAPSAQLPTSVALRVLVVNDPALAEAIGRLRGEWQEVSGGELTAVAKPWNEILAADSLDADVIVFPTRYMGELSSRGWLRPVRKSVLEDKALDFNDFFPLIRRRLIVWDGETMALPLGIDFPGATINWDSAGAVPYLVAVAPKLVEPTRTGDLFDPETMKPRIDDPALAALFHKDLESSTESQAVGRVPVLGFGDRMASVTTASRNAASAFKLLAWLASADVSTQLARAGSGAQPARKSLAASATWYSSGITEGERSAAGKNLQAALEGDEALIVPRIPGVDQYMAALQAAMKRVAIDKANPEDALKEAAAKWEQFTDARGRDAQRQAYLKHLGISEQ